MDLFDNIMSMLSQFMLWIWGGLAIIFVILEISLSGILQIWFAIGAICAGVVAWFFPTNIVAQGLVFLVVSGVLTAIFTKMFSEKGDHPLVSSNPVYTILGKTAIVTKEIDTPKGLGQISINGDKWSAKTTIDQVIPENTKVIIKEIDGVKAVVEPIDE